MRCYVRSMSNNNGLSYEYTTGSVAVELQISLLGLLFTPVSEVTVVTCKLFISSVVFHESCERWLRKWWRLRISYNMFILHTFYGVCTVHMFNVVLVDFVQAWFYVPAQPQLNCKYNISITGNL